MGETRDLIRSMFNASSEDKPLTEKTIAQVASVIDADWSKTKSGIYFGARPYLNAMYSLNSISDNYGQDSAKSIIMYFLANATTWRGETAKAVKSHLKSIIK